MCVYVLVLAYSEDQKSIFATESGHFSESGDILASHRFVTRLGFRVQVRTGFRLGM